MWTKTAGSADIDEAGGIALDSNNNVYISCGVGKNAKFGKISLNNTQAMSILAKLDTSGNWQWAKPGLYSNLTTDPQGNSYMTGYFTKSFTIGSFTLTPKGTRDMYVVKFDANGTCKWAKSYGISGGSSSGYFIQYLPNGDFHVIGGSTKALQLDTYSVDPTISKFFEAKMDANGNWTKLKQRMTGSELTKDTNYRVTQNRVYMLGKYRKDLTVGGLTLPITSDYQGFLWSQPSL